MYIYKSLMGLGLITKVNIKYSNSLVVVRERRWEGRKNKN